MVDQAGDRERAGDGTHADDDVVVLNGKPQASVSCNRGTTICQSEFRDPPGDYLRMRTHHGQRRHGVAYLDDARRHLRKHRSEEHGVLGVDDGCAPPSEQTGDRRAPETPAHHQNAAPGSSGPGRRELRHASRVRWAGRAGPVVRCDAPKTTSSALTKSIPRPGSRYGSCLPYFYLNQGVTLKLLQLGSIAPAPVGVSNFQAVSVAIWPPLEWSC